VKGRRGSRLESSGRQNKAGRSRYGERLFEQLPPLEPGFGNKTLAFKSIVVQEQLYFAETLAQALAGRLMQIEDSVRDRDGKAEGGGRPVKVHRHIVIL
jgi:hypothetical protein